jgi:hypothetical protein
MSGVKRKASQALRPRAGLLLLELSDEMDKPGTSSTYFSLTENLRVESRVFAFLQNEPELSRMSYAWLKDADREQLTQEAEDFQEFRSEFVTMLTLNSRDGKKWNLPRNFPNLVALRVRHSRALILATAVDRYASLAEFSRLSYLDMSGVHMSAQYLQNVVTESKLGERLQFLNIAFCGFETRDPDTELAALLSLFTRLIGLDITGCPCGLETVDKIKKMLSRVDVDFIETHNLQQKLTKDRSIDNFAMALGDSRETRLQGLWTSQRNVIEACQMSALAFLQVFTLDIDLNDLQLLSKITSLRFLSLEECISTSYETWTDASLSDTFSSCPKLMNLRLPSNFEEAKETDSDAFLAKFPLLCAALPHTQINLFSDSLFPAKAADSTAACQDASTVSSTQETEPLPDEAEPPPSFPSQLTPRSEGSDVALTQVY